MPDIIVCPVDFILMDENKARLTAGGIFTLLESAFSFCAGCYVYHFYNKAFKK